MVTESSADPGAHPSRHAALAAHALREALSDSGLLEHFPQCSGEVLDGHAMVQLGAIHAAGALQLAERLKSSKSRRRASATDT